MTSSPRPRCANPRRPSLLIVGCGDVGMRVLRHLPPSWRVFALTSSPERCETLRRAGALPVVGNLDVPQTLDRLGSLADCVLHLAPPATQGRLDERTASLMRALARGGRVRRLVYASTTGVYGDCGGERVDETCAPRPATDRARRRVDAESRVMRFGRASGCSVTVLRVPGIYALDRPGGDPRERIARGAPVLHAAEDVFTNHIHADDLARACVRALTHGGPQRVINVCDDTELRMGDHYDRVADAFSMPRPPRVSREQARQQLPAATLSFMLESRRVSNARLKRELRLVLRHPTVTQGLGIASPGLDRRGGGSGADPTRD